MELKIITEKGKEERIQVKFLSFWGIWALAYLATAGVIFVATIIFVLLGSMLGV